MQSGARASMRAAPMLLVLPGLEEGDAIETDPDLGTEQHTCPLTLHDAAACDTHAFLQEMLLLCESAATWRCVRARALLLAHQKHWPACLPPARIAACGHVFAALPLLYAVMEGGFRCPMCRGGSNERVHLTRAATPGLAPELWELLCLLCTEARRRALLAQLAENEAAAREIQGSAPAARTLLVSEILELMSVRAIFSIYRAGVLQADGSRRNVGAHDWPVSVMVLNLQPRAQITPAAPVVFESGTSRHVSRPLRVGGVFAVRIVADAFDQTQVLFDSHRVEYPRHALSAGSPQAIDVGVPGESEDDNTGELRMAYEACPFDHLHFLKRVYFTSSAPALRDVFARF